MFDKITGELIKKGGRPVKGHKRWYEVSCSKHGKFPRGVRKGLSPDTKVVSISTPHNRFERFIRGCPTCFNSAKGK